MTKTSEKVNRDKVRIALTTRQIAKAFGIEPHSFRGQVSQGSIKLSGDPVRDFRTLAREYVRRNS